MDNNKITAFIDAHLHFGGKENEIMSCLDIFTQLMKLGLKKVFLLSFATYGLKFSDLIRVIPYHAKHHYETDFVDPDPILEKVREKIKDRSLIAPFLDFRIINGDIESWLDHYLSYGYMGLKSLFIPEYDGFLKIESPITVLKITKSIYLNSQERTMDYAQKKNLPMIYHINLHNYFDYARELLTNFPHLRINFPHIGFSRKKMATLLDNFENCHTDISGLKQYIEKDPKDYCEYIEYYRDQIMFGTDSAWTDAGNITEYINLLEGLPIQEDCKKNLVYSTALKFLGEKNKV